MELASIQWFFDKLESWIGKATKSEQEAVNKFLDALNETNMYLGRISSEISQANRESEEKLSTLWNDAAKSIRTVDEELYSYCIAKACSWANSDQFKKSDMKDVNISINNMLNLAKKKGLA